MTRRGYLFPVGSHLRHIDTCGILHINTCRVRSLDRLGMTGKKIFPNTCLFHLYHFFSSFSQHSPYIASVRLCLMLTSSGLHFSSWPEGHKRTLAPVKNQQRPAKTIRVSTCIFLFYISLLYHILPATSPGPRHRRNRSGIRRCTWRRRRRGPFGRCLSTRPAPVSRNTGFWVWQSRRC
jgi:hypothetical protein